MLLLGSVARDVVGGVLWRGFFGAMGFTHPQPNFANSIRLRKKTIPFHAIWGLMLVYFFQSEVFSNVVVDGSGWLPFIDDELATPETTGFPTRPIAGCRTIGTTTSAGMDGQEAGRPNDWQNEIDLVLVEFWLTTHSIHEPRFNFNKIFVHKQK